MPDNELAGATALVTGASRGFGRGIAVALSRAGAQVAGVARDRSPLEELSAELGGSFTAVTADAADLTVAGQLTDAYRPAILRPGGTAWASGSSRYFRSSPGRPRLGAVYVAAYAARQGMDTAAFLEACGLALTAEQAGKAIIGLTGPGYDPDAYLLTATGLSPVA